MSYAKKRLAVFLSMLVVLTTVFGLIPPAQQVQAAQNVTLIREGYQDVLCVQKGMSNLYMGDYVSASWYDELSHRVYRYLTNLKGVTYKSSNTSVISVDKTGKMNAKKAGTAKLTVKYKGVSYTREVKVVNSVKKYVSDTYFEDAFYKKCGASFLKAYGKGITAKNRYTLTSILKKVDRLRYHSYCAGETSVSVGNQFAWIIYEATFVHANRLAENLSNYAEKINPFSTRSSKTFNITKLSGKGNTITATLSSKVSADQIFGIQYSESWNTEVKSTSKVDFPIYVCDESTGHRYYAVASVKKGSKQITIKTKSLKLKKGRKYRLKFSNSAYEEKDWLYMSEVSTFKAK